MTVFLSDPDVTLYCGDALEVLRQLPSESVHMACTSPPFYGLRDYGTGTWEGGDEGCDHKPPPRPARATRPDPHGFGTRSVLAAQDERATAYRGICGKCGARRVDQQIGLEATPDEWVARLVEVFREVRRVLRHDSTCWVELGDSFNANQGAGFNAHEYTRPHLSGEGVGQKRIDVASRNTRCGNAGVKPKDMLGQPWLLAFALRADGWWLRSEIIWAKPNPMPESVTDRPTVAHSRVFLLTKSPRYFYNAEAIREPHSPDGRAVTTRTVGNGSHENYQDFGHEEGRERWPNGGRNRRSVWTIPTEPYPDAHFATWPQKLVEPMILAGSREGGIVLDPFAGSGTTLHVARRLGRRAIGIELSPDYCRLAANRLAQQSLFAESVFPNKEKVSSEP